MGEIIMDSCKVISILNWKGGVGKTTLTHHLATGMNNMNLKEIGDYFEISGAPRILLIDADAQCSLSTLCLGEDLFEDKIVKKKGKTLNDLIGAFLVDGSQNLDVRDFIIKKSVRADIDKNYSNIDLISSHPDLIFTDMNIAVYSKPDFKNNLINSAMYKFQMINDIIERVKDDYDLVFIDCPPNLYYVTQNALFASDYYLIPTIPDRLSCYGIPSIYNKVNDLNDLLKQNCAGYVETKLIGIVVNCVKEYNNEPKETQATAINILKKNFGNKVFENYLSAGDGIPKAYELSYPVFQLEKSKVVAAKQCEQIRNIIREFSSRI